MLYEINEVLKDDGGYSVFQVPDVIKNPKEFTLYQDDIISDDQYASIRRELAYSFDGTNWTNWQHLTSALLKSDAILGKGNLQMRIRITKVSSNSSVKINNIQIEYTETPADECEPEVISKYMGLEFCADPEFDPYKVSAQAAQLESALNGYINKSIGMQVQYFHVLPDKDNEDSILNEYSTFKESGKGGKCIKIMVPENMMPEVNLMHNEWGIDFEKFEVHVQIEYFETIWGHGEEPRQEDIIYFPKFNRLFYVSSVKGVRGTDGIGQYWAMNLKKYDHNSAVTKSDETTELLEALTEGHSHQENFEEKNQNEGIDITNPIQNTVKTTALDELRSFIDPSISIIDKTVYNNGTPISHHQYNLDQGKPGQIGVIYKPSASIKDDMALTFWLNRNNPNNITDDTILYYRNLSNYLPFAIVNTQRLDLKKVQIIVDKAINQTGIYLNGFIQNGSTIYFITQIIDDFTFVVNTPDVVVEGTYRVATCEILPSTYSQLQGYLMAFVAGRYVYMILGNAHFKFDTGLQTITEEWIAFLINVSSTHSFIEVYVYGLENRFPQYPQKYSTVLKQLSKQMKPISQSIVGFNNLSNHPLYLSFSNSKITNIRLWNTPVEEEIHSLVLNQMNVQAANKAYVIDNADPVYLLDKLGKGITKFYNNTPDTNPEE